MKRDTTNYFLSGLVVIISLAFLGFVLLQLTGRNSDLDQYTTHYDNVYGLNFGTPVFYQGFRVGQVDNIQPEELDGGMHFKIFLSIESGWPVPSDSQAVLTSAGLLADVYIEIARGQSRQLVQPGGEIVGSQVVDVFAAFTELAEEASKLTRDGLGPLVTILNERVDRISQVMVEQTPEILTDTRLTIQKLQNSATQLEQILSPKTSRQVQDFLGNMSNASGQISQLSQDLHQTRGHMDQLLIELHAMAEESRPEIQQSIRDLSETMDNLAEQSDDVLYNLNNASRNIDEFTRQIYKNPTRLLKSMPEDDTR